ncbi:hypothetical protein DFJ43DRAFT_1002020 [Lentinula guzmanii]|uniref:Uncharacterized protein n=1 Tax=Lentinula guzmanii TaxID=2804957 RepID=A0AA38JIX1_9AGAR|nr:hypothetical protein DFJ43DRAFT_1002020 [Lentinula guzmanii]
MTTYSAFFSSGLLAAPHVYSSHSVYNNRIPSHGDPSPSLLNVSDVIDDTSDLELDRSTNVDGQATSTHQAQHCIRRRRSSLTVGTSPMNIIKSPSRAAGTALQLQRHLLTSPGRSRSGSTSSVVSIGEEVNSNIASESPKFPPPSAPLPALPSIPGTPSRSKAFSLAVPSIATQALARKLADNHSSRQPLGEIQLCGHRNDQEMRD